jgi:hypothetical protein
MSTILDRYHQPGSTLCVLVAIDLIVALSSMIFNISREHWERCNTLVSLFDLAIPKNTCQIHIHNLPQFQEYDPCRANGQFFHPQCMQSMLPKFSGKPLAKFCARIRACLIQLALSNRLVQTLPPPPPYITCTWLWWPWTRPCGGVLCCVSKSSICKQHSINTFFNSCEATYSGAVLLQQEVVIRLPHIKHNLSWTISCSS